MAIPSRDDPSRPQAQGADTWSAIQKALAQADGVKTIIALSGGSARVAGHLANSSYQVTAGTIPNAMPGQPPKLPETLSYASKSVDCLVSIDVLCGLEPESRRQLLREIARVSRRWVIADYCRGMKSEFEDTGLRVARMIPVRRFLSRGCVVLAECGFTDPQGLAIKLRETPYAEVALAERLGEGKRSVVYRAHWNGREVSVKAYKPAAIADHARKHPLPLAEFEHRRNKAFFEAPGMAQYVAEPLGCVVEPGFQMTVQELVDGEVYYFARRDHADFISPRFMDQLKELVALSHRARLYDIDLHAMNVMVDRQTGSPKLFDFNQIPFNERPQNPLVSLALKLGLLGPESRDLRKLEGFDDFERIERRLLRFYEKPAGSRK